MNGLDLKFKYSSTLVLLVTLFTMLNLDLLLKDSVEVIPEGQRMGQEAGCRPNRDIVHGSTASCPAMRESITFIMGDDHGKRNAYYQEAIDYYRYHEQDRTTYVVGSCRALLDVRNYLADHPPGNGRPWGRINIVLHGNQWNGFGIPVVPDGPRANTATINAAAASGVFPGLHHLLADQQTEIILQSCGVGRDNELLKAVSHAFGDPANGGIRPVVRSSRYFVFYESVNYNGQPITHERYLADYWYTSFKTGYRPGDIRLANRLRKKYPEKSIDWREVLSRKEPRWTGDSYTHSFDIPVVWYVTYPEQAQRPPVATAAEKQSWLANQPELLAAIRETGISFEDFSWTIYPMQYSFDDGSTEPAIKAIGFCTILCVLEPLTAPVPGDPENHMPIRPALTDTKYYTAEIPNAVNPPLL